VFEIQYDSTFLYPMFAIVTGNRRFNKTSTTEPPSTIPLLNSLQRLYHRYHNAQQRAGAHCIIITPTPTRTITITIIPAIQHPVRTVCYYFNCNNIVPAPVHFTVQYHLSYISLSSTCALESAVPPTFTLVYCHFSDLE
jgi:hypothetical protein